MIDKDLIQKCKSGDISAFERLIEAYSQKAFRTAYFIIKRKDLAEDLVQETFIKCYIDLPKLKNVEAFNAWFYKTLVHMSWRMSKRERLNFSLDETNVHKEFYKDYERLEDYIILSAERKERNLQIYNAINNLKPLLKTTIILYYFNDLSIKEISKIQGCLSGTVKSRLNTARKQIKTALQFKDDAQPTKNCNEKGVFKYE